MVFSIHLALFYIPLECWVFDSHVQLYLLTLLLEEIISISIRGEFEPADSILKLIDS
jgi:hypothetical protein